jgi:hypothetical protein
MATLNLMHTSHLPLPEDRVASKCQTTRFDHAGTLDVLIPLPHWQDFQAVVLTRKSVGRLFRSLLGRYRHRVVRTTDEQRLRLRTQYQKAGLELQRVSFRVEADVWADLRVLSLSCRVSMSQIMVWLVVWEARRKRLSQQRRTPFVVWDRVGTPSLCRLVLLQSQVRGCLQYSAWFARSEPIHSSRSLRWSAHERDTPDPGPAMYRGGA